MTNELREAAQRVTGYVRARALMSNTDPEVISDISIMPDGASAPMYFRLLVADLEALALHATGGTPTESPTKYGRCPVVGCSYRIEDHELPNRPEANFGDEANNVINMVADAAEELAAAAMIAHHVLDHTTAELMDTISNLRGQLQVEAVATTEEADSVIIPKQEYLELQEAADELAALHASGVENWEGYAEARSNR